MWMRLLQVLWILVSLDRYVELVVRVFLFLLFRSICVLNLSQEVLILGCVIICRAVLICWPAMIYLLLMTSIRVWLRGHRPLHSGRRRVLVLWLTVGESTWVRPL